MHKEISLLWLPVGIVWLLVAIPFANYLNGIERSRAENEVVPICLQTPDGTAALLSTKAKNCVGLRTTYGVPFPYVSTYVLNEPINNPITNTTTRTVTRYTGLFGQELTTTNRDVRRFGKTMIGWNYIMLLVTPFVFYFIFRSLRNNFKHSQ